MKPDKMLLGKRRMSVLAIDPGNEMSGYVIFNNGIECKPLKIGKIPNEEIMKIIKNAQFDYIAIEMIACYGMAVGRTVFETCVWIGRMSQVAFDAGVKVCRIYRREVTNIICPKQKANDSKVKKALIKRFAPDAPNRGKGNKKAPGFFFGFAYDIWQAFAVGVAFYEMYTEESDT